MKWNCKVSQTRNAVIGLVFYSDSLARTYDQIVIKLSKNEIEVQNVQDVNRIRLPFFTYWDKAECSEFS